MSNILPWLSRMLVCGALVFGLTAEANAGASGPVYSIDQHSGSIAFSVSHFGLFSSEVRFDRFTGRLRLDLIHPQDTSFRFNIDADSLAAPLAPATAMLRGPDFFDVAHYPLISYTSTSVARHCEPTAKQSPIVDAHQEIASPSARNDDLCPPGNQHYAISGVLQLRGVARPQPLDARLLNLRTDKLRHVDTAEFAVTGRLERSDFGIVANRLFVSDTVILSIQRFVELPAAPDGEGARALQPTRTP
jgi:polyisoprenoid-binding protein YceI